MTPAAPLCLASVLERPAARRLALARRPSPTLPARPPRQVPWLELLLCAALLALGSALWLARPRPAHGATGVGAACTHAADCPPSLTCTERKCAPKRKPAPRRVRQPEAC